MKWDKFDYIGFSVGLAIAILLCNIVFGRPLGFTAGLLIGACCGKAGFSLSMLLRLWRTGSKYPS